MDLVVHPARHSTGWPLRSLTRTLVVVVVVVVALHEELFNYVNYMSTLPTFYPH